jgi:glucose-1-phosphate adenylyltransferase
VYVAPEAIVRDSIVLHDTWIGPGALLDKVIVDADVVIGASVRLGYGDELKPNVAEPDKVNTGISVVGKGAHVPAGIRIGRNVVVKSRTDEDAFAAFGNDVPSGATV